MSVKRVYEAMFLFDPTVGVTWERVEEQMKRLMERAEGEIIKMKKWDERRLTYEVEGRKRGVYVLAFFRAPTEKIVGLERDCQLSEEILRVLVLCRDHMADEKAIEIVDNAQAYVPPPHHEGYGDREHGHREGGYGHREGGYGHREEYGAREGYSRDRDRTPEFPEEIPALDDGLDIRPGR